MGALTVLIVDDDMGDRAHLRRLLQKTNCNVDVVDVDSVEVALTSHDRAFDAVFLDHLLPELSGLSALNSFRETWPKAAIFLMTGQGNEDTAKSAILQGASDYIVKSAFSESTLLAVLNAGIASARARTRLEEQREDLATFAEVLVHDFRAPIRAAAYLSRQIEEDLAAQDFDEVRYGLAALQVSATQMMEMLTSLSDHIRLDREQTFEVVAAPELLDRALMALDLEATQKHAKIERRLADNLPPIVCQPPQIAQVLQNLVANSLKYAGQNTAEVQVSAAMGPCGMLIFEVEDQGIGIPNEFLGRIFEPFKRVPGKDGPKGTGLGLATCKKVVHRHGGRIWCESEIGKGTIMRFSLPISRLENDLQEWNSASRKVA